MQICCSDSFTALCWSFRELQTRERNMPDIVHAFRHAFMLHKQNTQFEDAKHEETSLHVCPAVGGGGWVGGGAWAARRALQVSGRQQ